MKNLILILLLFVSGVIFAQTQVTYTLDDQGKAIKISKHSKEVTLLFEENVPDLTDNQVSELLKNKKLILNEKKVKGYYENGILFYVPLVKLAVCYLKNDVVSFESNIPMEKDRIFSWWFVFAVLGIVSMILFQKLTNAGAVTFAGAVAGAFAVAFAFAGAVAVAVAVAFVGAVAVAFVVAFAFAVAVAVAGDKKLKNIFAYIYYALMILVAVLAYLQI